MRFTIQRETLIKALHPVVNVIERRNTLPVLANVLATVSGSELTFIGTDLEVEMVSRTEVGATEDGQVTLPGRKLFEIVRALPDGVSIRISQSGDRASLIGGRSRFTLATLPVNEFPGFGEIDLVERIVIPEATLKELIDRTAFAMAQDDVRFYLNGLLFDFEGRLLRCVSTDGHRLASCEVQLPDAVTVARQLILPRKGVLELQRLLEGGSANLVLEIGRGHVRIHRVDVTFTSKLIEGRFPDYEAVIPIGTDKQVSVNRDDLRAALQRVAILSNEKFRGVRVEVNRDLMRVVAHNPEQEEAQEELEAKTDVTDFNIGFNVTYLEEAIAALKGARILMLLRDTNSSALLREEESASCRNVVMPIRL